MPSTERAKGTGCGHLPLGLWQFSSVFTFLLLCMKKQPAVTGTSKKVFLSCEHELL